MLTASYHYFIQRTSFARSMTLGFFLVFYIVHATGQIPVGAWRDHLSYNRATHVALTESKVYCSAGAGLIIYNLDDNSVEKLSKVNGLSDNDISSIRWSDDNQILLIGYNNGNLDIIKDNKIINLSDILRSSVAGSKSINNILFIGNDAYLSTGFGIVVVNLERNEIKDNYFLGEGGVRLEVNDMAFDGTYLYAATSAGLYRADIDAPNLLDFSYWHRVDFLPEAGSAFISAVWFNGKLYTVQMEGPRRYNSYIINNESFEIFTGASFSPFIFRNAGNYLATVRPSFTEIYDAGQALVRRVDTYGFYGINIGDVEIDERTGEIWVADRIFGLVRVRDERFNVLTPPGPYSNRVFSITSYPERTYFAAGGYDLAMTNLWFRGEFSMFRNGKWTLDFGQEYRDVIKVIEHPGNPDNLFIASWGYGLIEYREDRFHERYAADNSSLTSIQAGDYVRIGGIAFDRDGNLWMTNSGVPNPVSVMKADGEWISFPYGATVDHNSIGDLIINRLGQKWVLLPRGGGLFVFENDLPLDETSTDRTRKLRIIDDTGSLISNEVYSIAEDNNGYIWVGTNNGVAIYYNPSRVFTDDEFHAGRIIVSGTRDEDRGYLLNNETVTAIAVDGADRKWLGTEKSGVFLVSPDGRTQIHHFTRHNSPLLDNRITDIAIDPSTGEVFFGTPAGVVSFRSDATAPADAFTDVYVFPNPVRQNYNGPVTITGLVKDAIVKITDISGNLVYETVSTGGQAVWGGRNSRGNRVNTGIYLVFVSSPDGTKSHVTKLMFIH